MKRKPDADAENGIRACQLEVVRGPENDLRAVGFEAFHDHAADIHHTGDLARDSGQELLGLRMLGDERRDAPQRCLLLHKPLQPTSIACVRVRHGCLGP